MLRIQALLSEALYKEQNSNSLEMELFYLKLCEPMDL